MEPQHYLQKNNFTPAPAPADRDKQLLLLYHDICDYFGFPANPREQSTPTRSDAARDLDYFMAISG